MSQFIDQCSSTGTNLTEKSCQIIPENKNIAVLADIGALCDIFGHNWTWTDSTPNWVYTGAMLDGSVPQRQCKVCGLRQRLVPETWEYIDSERQSS